LDGQRRSVSGRSRHDVQRKLDELRQRWRQGALPARAAEREPLAAYLERWLEGRRGTLEDKSWRQHERNVRIHLAPPGSALAALRLPGLTAPHLRDLYGRLLAPRGPLGPRSVRSVHTTIRQALDQAVEDGLLARNVARTLRSSQLPKLPASAI